MQGNIGRAALVLSLAMLSAMSAVGASRDGVDRGSVAVDKLTYHHDRERTGWNARETVLTPAAVTGEDFGPLWQSPQLDSFGDVPPRLFATPLYVHDVQMRDGSFAGERLPVAYVTTSTAWAYAISAGRSAGVEPGAIVWRRQLAAKPCYEGTQGSISTPVIDRTANRIYITSCDDDAGWRVHALDIRSGDAVPGWPITVTSEAVDRVNRNGTKHFSAPDRNQPGALNLSVDGQRLYIAFGPNGGGWLVVIDSATGKIVSAYSSTSTDAEDQGGIWTSAGASVDRQGRVYVATGANYLSTLMKKGVPGVFPESPGNWGQSILQFRDDRDRGLILSGTYAPFNYCQAAAADMDLGSSGVTLFDLPEGSTATPGLLALAGGKQGNFYLLDRDNMPGDPVKRQPCSTDPESDGSLLAPDPQPHFALRGPINLFRPYSDYVAMADQARSRSTAAYFRDDGGRHFVFVTGSTKTGDDYSQSAPPGLARVEIVAAPGKPAYPRIDGFEETQILENPGSPVVTSNGGSNAIVWVLDPNARRTVSLYGEGAPRPVLYAFDAMTLKLLWRSPEGELYTSGKYNEPTVVNGIVLVGTDRLQAYGLGGRPNDEEGKSRPVSMKRTITPLPGSRGTTAEKESIDAHALGKSIFEARCSGCHGTGQPGMPSRADLSKFSRAKIVESLTSGLMQAMAAGLSGEEIGSVAKYLRPAE